MKSISQKILRKNGDTPLRESFGAQLRKYREAIGLTQAEYAEFLGITPKNIVNAELGKHSVGLDNVEKFAKSFGVQPHELLNPAFPVPAIERMPKAIQRTVKAIQQQKDQQDKGYQTGLAKRLHELVAAGFFNRSKTAKATFAKLHPEIQKADYGKHTVQIGKIANTLRSGKFAKLLDKIEPAPNSVEVRFLQKTPGIVSYPMDSRGTTDLAADGD